MYFVTDKKSLKQAFTNLNKFYTAGLYNKGGYCKSYYMEIYKTEVSIDGLGENNRMLFASFKIPCTKIDFENYQGDHLALSLDDIALMLATINSTQDDSKVTIDISHTDSNNPQLSYITKQGTFNFKATAIDDVVMLLQLPPDIDKTLKVNLKEEGLSIKNIAKKLSFLRRPYFRPDTLNNVKFTLKDNKLSIFASDCYSVAKYTYNLKHKFNDNTYTALVNMDKFKKLATSPDMFTELIFGIKENNCAYLELCSNDSIIAFSNGTVTDYPNIKLPIPENHKLENNAELDYKNMLDLIGTLNRYKVAAHNVINPSIELIFNPEKQVLTVNTDNNKENGYFSTDIPCKIDTETDEDFTINFSPTKLYKALSKIKGKGYENAKYYLSCTPSNLKPIVIENTVDQGYQQYIMPMKSND